LNLVAAVFKDQHLISKTSGFHMRALALAASLPPLVPLRVVPTRWFSLVALLERL